MSMSDRVSYVRLEKMLFEAGNKSVAEMWEVRQGQPTPERLAKTALGSVFQSEYARRALRTFLLWRDFPGYRLIGQGHEQAVYQRGKNVLKILHNTGHYDPMEPEEIAEKLQDDSDRCRDYLGDTWAPTDYEVKRVSTTGEKVVVAHQPLISPANFHLSMDHLAADRTVDRKTKLDFADQLEGLCVSTGLQADVIGVNNVASLDTGRMVVADTIAVDRQRQQEFDTGSGLRIGNLITRQVDLLRVA